MAKLLGMSVLFVPMLVALYASRLRNPRRGVRLVLLFSLAFGVAYVVALHFLYIPLVSRQ